MTLPVTIPIFPLQDVVLFPNSTRPLHIFELRYDNNVIVEVFHIFLTGRRASEKGPSS